MPFFNVAAREINVKLVYYGPAFSGKTTTFQRLYHTIYKETRTGRNPFWTTEAEPTLFFDFVASSLPLIRGFRVRFHLYALPGLAQDDAAQRRCLLQAVDGLVFVADSRPECLNANLESLNHLRAELADQGRDKDAVPLALQYNKQDLENAVPFDTLDLLLNPSKHPAFASVAVKSQGVFETLRACAKLLVLRLQET